jgi:hypothetical protein
MQLVHRDHHKENVSLTRKLCGPSENDTESAIVRAFNRTQYLKEKPGELTFLSGKREPLLVWRSAETATNAPSGATERAIKAAPATADRSIEPLSRNRGRAQGSHKRMHTTHRGTKRLRESRLHRSRLRVPRASTGCRGRWWSLG